MPGVGGVGEGSRHMTQVGVPHPVVEPGSLRRKPAIGARSPSPPREERSTIAVGAVWAPASHVWIEAGRGELAFGGQPDTRAQPVFGGRIGCGTHGHRTIFRSCYLFILFSTSLPRPRNFFCAPRRAMPACPAAALAPGGFSGEPYDAVLFGRLACQQYDPVHAQDVRQAQTGRLAVIHRFQKVYEKRALRR